LEKMTARFFANAGRVRDRRHTDRYGAEEPPRDDPLLRNKTNAAPNRQSSPGQEIAIESLTRGIVNHIIDDPISRLEKVACGADASAVIDIVFRLFDLRRERYPNGEDFAEKAEKKVES
jgi:hypothetical protein